MTETFGFDIDVDRYRRVANLGGCGVKADKISDKDWLVKQDLFHRDGHEALVFRVPYSFDAARNVDITQYHATKNRAVRIRITRHHRQSYRRISYWLLFHIFDLLCESLPQVNAEAADKI